MPSYIDISRDGRFVYVSNSISNEVTVIETTTNKVIKTIQVGEMPAGIVATPDNRYVFVADYPKGIQVIDTKKLEIIKTLAADSFPAGMTATPDRSPTAHREAETAKAHRG